jgi:acylpyruvate hydrolase
LQFLTFRESGAERLGVVDGDRVVDLQRAVPSAPSDLRIALASGFDLKGAAGKALMSGSRLPLASLTLASPVPRPGKIICLGLNYFDHAQESGKQKPDYPWFFMRSATSLVDPAQAALKPKVSDRFDYEAELAVVIGRDSGRHVPRARALDLVFGYSCFNDMSVRDYQKKTPQWTVGKNFDRTGAFGPVLVTADELPPGGAGLSIECRLNGAVMQSASTSDMIFSVAETIELLTQCMTLEAGDVLVMGTPAGVGQSRTPPVWMKAGDEIEVAIERIGSLVNPIVDE